MAKENHITTKGFILRIVNYRENNLILDILTADYGLITCSYSGRKSKNNSLRRSISPFIFAEFKLFYYRNRYSLNSLDIIESFSPLMEDLERLTCLSHLSELVMDILRHQPKASNVYPFWAYSSYCIVYQKDPILTTHLSQLKFISDQGFSPWIEDCLICHKPIKTNIVNFYLNRGGVICDAPACRKHTAESSIVLLHRTNIDLISYLLKLPYEKCFNLDVEHHLRAELLAFSKRYVNTVMEKEYKKLDILSTMEKFEKGIYE
ncbi:MAG: DNA repair protein RecO [Clostridiaceae bacterium]|nr:DNA repair protein RecO [Clostridiaceae bacterium]